MGSNFLNVSFARTYGSSTEWVSAVQTQRSPGSCFRTVQHFNKVSELNPLAYIPMGQRHHSERSCSSASQLLSTTCTQPRQMQFQVPTAAAELKTYTAVQVRCWSSSWTWELGRCKGACNLYHNGPNSLAHGSRPQYLTIVQETPVTSLRSNFLNAWKRAPG